MVRPFGRSYASDWQTVRSQNPGLKVPGYYADGGDLYFRVTGVALPSEWKALADKIKRRPAGAGSSASPWVARRRDIGLGSYPDITLAKARELATECRRMVGAGVDPIEARKARRASDLIGAAKSMTFDQCATAYIAAHEKELA